MMKAFGLLSFFLLGACSSGGGGQSKGDAGDRIRVFYNNDNFAYLEPCGCRISPIGGIDRRWNGMKAYPDESRVFVDAGNLLFKSTTATEFNTPQWFEQAKGMVEGYNLLKADAVEPGSTDFALGVEKFEEIAKGANFPFVSANLYRKKSGERFLKDSVIIERYGKKIGVFGIFHPSLPLPPELEARDPIAAAAEEVKILRSEGADLVIALAHEGFDNDVILRRKVPGIDLIVGANSQSLLQSPDEENGSLIVQLSNQGQMLGMVEYDPNAKPMKRTKFEVAELNADFNEGPRGLANPMKNLLAVTNLKMTEANHRLDEQLEAAHQASSSGGYQTFLSCRDCHTSQAKFQEGKPHAAAFLTLVAKKKEMNLDCLKCHSVGMGKEGGFNSLTDAFRDRNDQPVPFEKIREAMGAKFPSAGISYRSNQAHIRPDVARFIASLEKAGVKKSFPTVQCENCHGGMPNHPFSEATAAHSAVKVDTCVQCHTRDQMPAWYDKAGKLNTPVVEAAKKKMACPR